MKLGLNLLFPCFILSLIPGNPALKTMSSALWAIGLGFALVATAHYMLRIMLAMLQTGELWRQEKQAA